MRVCQLCAGPMPKIVRDDALYCSTSCKLKAQRKRKKERARQENDEGPHFFEPIVPFGNVEQQIFPFMEDVAAPSVPTSEAPAASGSTEIPKPPPTSSNPKPQSWLDRVVEQIKIGVRPPPRVQRPRGKGSDII